MLVNVVIHGRSDRVFSGVFDRCDRITRHRLSKTDFSADTLSYILATARFSPGLELLLSDIINPDKSQSVENQKIMIIRRWLPFLSPKKPLRRDKNAKIMMKTH